MKDLRSDRRALGRNLPVRHLEGEVCVRRLVEQLRGGTLEYCVLSLLAGEERYGFELIKLLGDVEGMVTTEGTIYPLLSRLRRDGLVETTWQESLSGPPRRYYRTTPAGRDA